MEDDFLPNSIAGEQFQHNHEKRIKAQSLLMSMEYYMEIVVLPHDMSRQLFYRGPPASSGKPMVQAEIPIEVEWEEIDEPIYEDIKLHQESKPSYSQFELMSLLIYEDLYLQILPQSRFYPFCYVQKKEGMRGRKSLADVSNTKRMICADEGLNKKNHVKLTSVMEDDFLPNSIAEEQFQHNHEKRIKALSLLTSMEYYMEIVVLPHDMSRQLFYRGPPASSGKPMVQPEIPIEVGLEEIDEPMYEDIKLHQESKPSYWSLMTPKSPESLDLEPTYSYWDVDANFTLKPHFYTD